jgi:hemolysin-activating ACP:hemolysin acyltransferase
LLLKARSKERGFSVPIGVALWASVSDEVDQRLAASLDHPMRVRPDEWKSGDHLRLIEAAGSPKIVNALVERLQSTAFAGRAFKLRTVGEGGRLVVRSLAPKAASAAA